MPAYLKWVISIFTKIFTNAIGNLGIECQASCLSTLTVSRGGCKLLLQSGISFKYLAECMHLTEFLHHLGDFLMRVCIICTGHIVHCMDLVLDTFTYPELEVIFL